MPWLRGDWSVALKFLSSLARLRYCAPMHFATIRHARLHILFLPVLLGLALICGSVATAPAQGTPPNHDIDFMTSHTLGDVLKSGLRPWQTSNGVFMDGTERWVTVYLQRRRSFKMLSVNSRFHVLTDYRIQRAEFSSTIMQVTHGREAVYHVLRYLGIPNDGIDALIASMGTQPDITKFWSGDLTLNNRKITVQLRPRTLNNTTGLTFSVIIDWPILPPGTESETATAEVSETAEAETAAYLASLTPTAPLPAPPGYREEDIAPPKDLSTINPAPAKPVADFEQQGVDVFDNRRSDYYR